MDARWIPILAAALGLLGGLGGAFVGGWVANEGEERRFGRERAVAIQDLRRQIYTNYLQTVDGIEAKIQVDTDGKADYVRLRTAEASVSLIAHRSNVREAAERLADSLSAPKPFNDRDYLQARGTFIRLAQQEITTG
jgi:hypothetical protein